MLSPDFFRFRYAGETHSILIDPIVRMNITKFCAVFKRKPDAWKRTKANKILMKKCAKKYNLNEDDVVYIKKGGAPKDLISTGTYMHMELAREVVYWCNKRVGSELDAWNIKHNNQDNKINEQSHDEDEHEDKKENKEEEIDPESSFLESTDVPREIIQMVLKLPNGKDFLIPMRDDGFLHATLLCKASGKRLDNWMRLEHTNRLIKALELGTSLTSEHLIQVINTGNKKFHGTYIHPDLQVPLAMWLSEDFAIQISRWGREILLTGKVEIGKEKSENELAKSWDQISQLKSALTIAKNELQNRPTLVFEESHEYREQIITDQMIDDFMQNYNLDIYHTAYVIYIAYIGIYNGLHTFKFGKTRNIKTRVGDHIRDFGKFNFIFVRACDADYVEENLKKFADANEHRAMLMINGKNQTELFYTTKNAILKDFVEETKRLTTVNRFVDNKTLLSQLKEMEAINTLNNEIMEFKIKEAKLQSETEIKIVKLQSEVELKDAKFQVMEMKLRMDNMTLQHKLDLLLHKTAST